MILSIRSRRGKLFPQKIFRGSLRCKKWQFTLTTLKCSKENHKKLELTVLNSIKNGVNLTQIFVMKFIFAIFYLELLEFLICFGIWGLGLSWCWLWLKMHSTPSEDRSLDLNHRAQQQVSANWLWVECRSKDKDYDV